MTSEILAPARPGSAALPTPPAPDALTAGQPPPAATGPRLQVRNLHVGFRRDGGLREIVHGLSFDLHPGRCVAIVGESGSGKSVTARTLVGLPGRGAEVRADALRLGSDDLLTRGERDWRRIRGAQIGFVLQDALVSLDPLRPVGSEIAEALRLHGTGPRSARRRRVVELLAAAGVPEPEVRARQRPGELSGGLRQRALIASAIALGPQVLIADEPTTALDVTVQAQVLGVFEQMKSAGRSLVLISHDLSVVAHLADEVLVMRGGHVVEQGPVARVLADPAHPYTRALIRAVPSAATRGRRLSGPEAAPPAVAVRGTGSAGGASGASDARPAAPVPAVPELSAALPAIAAERATEVVLEVRDLVRVFPRRGGTSQRAVDGVSFRLRRGEVLGIVGESGSGKSTTARIALGLETADSGEVILLGHPWSALSERHRRALRTRISVVYQDPLSSFDPRFTVERVIRDALPGGRGDVHRLLALVGLGPEVAGRNPATMSGGQRQRVAIARALAPEPDVLVLDEAVSALDVSVQAQILDLLADLRRDLGTSVLFISHDLGVISHLSDRVLVMKDGRVVESGSPSAIFDAPAHPYTRTLVDSLTTLDRAAATATARSPAGDARRSAGARH